ncbi:MAG: carboxypeptidase regulatory-like domain-containing protein, partial [Bacteroidetes bacterium]|nr:carboxypeptidase regulatory-like domain-containing protein [Bacteroidota bacterium]
MKRHVLLVAALCLAGIAAVWAQGTVPPVPTDLTAVLYTDPAEGARLMPSVKLDWNAPDGEWGYVVYRSVDDSVQFQKLAMTNTTMYYDHTVRGGHTYFYYVTSVMIGTGNQMVQSGPSNIAFIQIGDTVNRPTGVIAGTVTDDSTGDPLRGIRISFSRLRGYTTLSLPFAITDSMGMYSAKLDTGTYKVKAEPAPWMPPDPPPYRAEWFDDKPDWESADPVQVMENASTPADFGLSRVLIPTRPKGTVTGTVIDDATQLPIPGILIKFMKKGPVTVNWQPVAVTDSLGVYTMVLDTGIYFLKTGSMRMSPIDYIHEWYDNVTDPSLATPVQVEENSTFEANFGLGMPVPPVYVNIEGFVTDTLGNPLRRASVAILRSLQKIAATNALSYAHAGYAEENVEVEAVGYCRGVVWKGFTDSLGYYKARVIADTSYIALAAKWGFIPEYFDNKSSPLLADIINASSNVQGINFSLAPNPVYHNSISGLVRDSLGTPAPSIVVVFPAYPTFAPVPIRFGHTDSLGAYTIGDVVQGVYIVLALPFANYAPAFYKEGAYGVMHWKMADRVTIDGDVTGINIGVVPIQSTGWVRLRGRIHAFGRALAGVRVMAANAEGAVVGFGLSDAGGQYTLEAIPPGPITVSADLTDYAAAGQVVNVPEEGFEVNNVDFALQPDTPTDSEADGVMPATFA